MEIKPWLILWFNKLSVRTGPSTWVGWVEPRPVFPCVPATGRCYFFHLQYDVCIRICIHLLINVKLMIPINSAIMHPGGSWLKYIYIHIYLKNIIFLVWLDIIALCRPTTASAFSRADFNRLSRSSCLNNCYIFFYRETLQCLVHSKQHEEGTIPLRQRANNNYGHKNVPKKTCHIN